MRRRRLRLGPLGRLLRLLVVLSVVLLVVDLGPVFMLISSLFVVDTGCGPSWLNRGF